jgi:hypothetical protein
MGYNKLTKFLKLRKLISGLAFFVIASDSVAISSLYIGDEVASSYLLAMTKMVIYPSK